MMPSPALPPRGKSLTLSRKFPRLPNALNLFDDTPRCVQYLSNFTWGVSCDILLQFFLSCPALVPLPASRGPTRSSLFKAAGVVPEPLKPCYQTNIMLLCKPAPVSH